MTVTASAGELEEEALRLALALCRARRDGDTEAAGLIAAVAAGMLGALEEDGRPGGSP